MLEKNIFLQIKQHTWSSDVCSRRDSVRDSLIVILLALVLFRESKSSLFSKMLPLALASSSSKDSSSFASCIFKSSSVFRRSVFLISSSGFSFCMVLANNYNMNDKNIHSYLYQSRFSHFKNTTYMQYRVSNSIIIENHI